MFIVDQRRKKIANIDRASTVYLEGRVISAMIPIYGKCTLGAYDTTERAAEVFKQMLDECFAPPMVLFQNMDFAESAKKQIEDMPGLIIKTADCMPRVDKVELSCWYMPEK